MNRKIIFISLILVLHTAFLSAQSSRVLYFMNLPQNRTLNPALRSTDSVYVGLPGLSGIGMNVNNNLLNFSDVFSKGSNDSLYSFLHPSKNIDDFISTIRKKNFVEPVVTIPVFSLAFPVRKGYLFLDVNERAEMNLVVPGSLIEFALKGNAGYVGDKLDLSAFRAGMRMYHEIGLGYSRNYTSKLRVGIKGKILLGVASVSVKPRTLGITVNNDYSHTLNADLNVNISGPIDVVRDAENNIDDFVFDDDNMLNYMTLKGPKNLGLAFDFGATYKLTRKITLSAAVTDFGFINWKNNTTNLKTDDKYVFNGFDVTEVLNGDKTFDEVAEQLGDSLKNSFSFTETYDPYKTILPMGLNIGGNYAVSKNFSVGVLSSSRIIGRQFRQALTLSGNVKLGNMFSTSLSYSAENHRLDNIGVGMMLKLGWLQFYVLSDNIPIAWNKFESYDNMGNPENKVMLPNNWNTVDLRLGMNLVFGNRKARKEARMVAKQ
ncbi:MAG TPA: DUF5723 family protein [Bacteroidales bacterium]|nr:DUF5723 family protein [Bacteroidales bacterium]